MSRAFCTLTPAFVGSASTIIAGQCGARESACDIIVLAYKALFPLQARINMLYPALSTRFTSFSKSSYRNKHLPAATVTKGSAATAVVQHAGIEHRRPSESWK
jgi:hypothetical protein